MTRATIEENIVEALQRRASAIRLGAPGPSTVEIETMIRCAVTAPDHGRVRPWRFTVFEENQRHHFGNLLADTLKDSDPLASDDRLAKEREKAQRSPVIIVAAAHLKERSTVPAIEQIIAVGAAAEHLILAANALGYGAMWKTGAAAYADRMKIACGLEQTDSIVGFIYLGTELPGPSPLPRAGIEGVVQYWKLSTDGA